MCLSEPGFHSVAQADPKLIAILLPQHLRARVIAMSHHYFSLLLAEPERSPKAGLCIPHLHFLTPHICRKPAPFLSCLCAFSFHVNKQMCSEHPASKMCRNCRDTPSFFPEAANPSRVCLHLSLIYPHASVTGFSNLLLNWHYSGQVSISVFTVLEVGTILRCSPFFLLRCLPPFWAFILLVPLMFQNLSPLPVLQGQVSCFSHYVSLLHPRSLG